MNPKANTQENFNKPENEAEKQRSQESVSKLLSNINKSKALKSVTDAN